MAKNRSQYTKKTAEKALAEGISIGEARGIEKGIEKGREERENRKAVEIAKNLLSQKVEINTISSATGLSIAEIQKLKV